MKWFCLSQDDVLRAFDECSNGDTIDFHSGMTCVVPVDTLRLMGKERITVNGNDSLILGKAHGNLLAIQDCSHCIISNLELRGLDYLKAPNDLYFALCLFTGRNEWITLNDCRFVDSGNHGAAHLNGPRTSDHVTFNHCQAIRCGNLASNSMQYDGAGFALGGSWITYNDCYTEGCYRGWELESGPANEYPTSHITLNRCVGYRNLHQNVTVMRMDGRADLCRDIMIDSCVFEGWGDVKGNPIDSAQVGVYFGGGCDSRIVNCDISRMHDGIGIHLDPVYSEIYGIEIKGNRIHDCFRPAVHMLPQDSKPRKAMRDVIITENRVRRITGSHGMWLSLDQDIATANNDIDEVGSNCDLVKVGP